MNTLEKIYKLYLENPLITTDSRNVVNGSIFFALKGESFDGNKFAVEAINKGCIASVVDDPDIKSDKCFYVNSVLETLQTLSTLHRKTLGLKVIAITGSNGKTTTKELINCVLSQKYKVLATKGNLNNHIGVPLTLLSLSKDIEIAIVEMGANHPGEIKFLSSIANPDYGIITNIGMAHLDGFGSFEGVKKTKGELYGYISEMDGTIFYNSKNNHLSDLVKQYDLENNSITYGFGLKSVKIKEAANSPYLCLEVIQKDTSSPIFIQTALVGNYNFENVLAAITVGLYMDVSIESIKVAIETFQPSNNRSQLVKTSYNTIILDAYNANPSSMELSLRNFALLEGDKKIAIIGEMLELGNYSEYEHNRIANIVKSLGFSMVIMVGKGFEKYSDNCIFFLDSDQCEKFLSEHLIRNSVVLVKGSRGVKLEKVLDQL
ncbi:MAG: UDP-N-acetylmuramoyl-tripeptide--D-alanyl-D-alanine ligase [Tenuifilaceae bacterium]